MFRNVHKFHVIRSQLILSLDCDACMSKIDMLEHFIGLDVGTGSSRACLINESGDVLSVAVKEFRTWHERADYYVSLGKKSCTDDRNNLQKISGLLVVM